MATDDKDKKEEKESGFYLGSNAVYNSDIWKRRKEEIDAMPEGPEKERAKFLLAQDYAGLKDILGADVSSSEAMFNTAMPEGRQAGGVYVAANPLEFLSSALRQGIGAKGRRNSMDALRQLSADQAEARGDLQFPGGAQAQPQAQGNHNMPIAGLAAAEAAMGDPQKPDLSQYGVQLGQNPQGAGMGQVTPRHVQNAVDRRQNVREQGGTPPPVGQGAVGQVKQNALRSMGKPDLSRYGAPTVNAGMGQFTQHLNKEAPKRYPMPQRSMGGASGSWGDANMLDEENPWDNDPMAAIPRGDEKQMLFELLKRNRR